MSRHLSDMEEAGMIVREIDPNDRRRIFLRPTERLETVGREFLQARIRTMREQGLFGPAQLKLTAKLQSILRECSDLYL